jgi:hypothetical protein
MNKKLQLKGYFFKNMSIWYCTIIGPNVPAPKSGSIGVVRVGIGRRFWEYQMAVKKTEQDDVVMISWPRWVDLLRINGVWLCGVLSAIQAFGEFFRAKERKG